MELRHLRYFLAAAEELHFGRAADRLFVTRPAVSQTISDLETELDVKLFFRIGQKISLTAAGEAFKKDVSLILADLARSVQTTRRIGKGKSGHLNVGYGSLSLRHPAFRASIKAVRQRYSDIDISLQEMASSVQIPAVRAGRLDAGFVFVPKMEDWPAGTVSEFLEIDDLGHLLIEDGGLSVATPSDHRLADRESVTLTDIADEELVLVPRSNVTPSLGLLETLSGSSQFNPRVVQEVGNISTQINLISVGTGIGLFVNTPQMGYPPGVAVLPLIGVDLPAKLCLVWRKDAEEPTLRSFIEQVRQSVREIVPA